MKPIAGRNPPSCAPVGLGSRGSGVSPGRQSPARPEGIPDAAPGAAAAGEPGDEAQLLQSSCSTYENKRKEEKTSAITHCRGSRRGNVGSQDRRELSRSIPAGTALSHTWRRGLCHRGSCHPQPPPLPVPTTCITGRCHNHAGSQPIQALDRERAFGEPDTPLNRVTASSQLPHPKQNQLHHCCASCSTSSSPMPPSTAPHCSRLLLHFFSTQNRLCFTFLGVAVKYTDFICSFSWGWWEKVPTDVPGPSISNPSLFHGWFSWERLQQPHWQLHC